MIPQGVSCSARIIRAVYFANNADGTKSVTDIIESWDHNLIADAARMLKPDAIQYLAMQPVALSELMGRVFRSRVF